MMRSMERREAVAQVAHIHPQAFVEDALRREVDGSQATNRLENADIAIYVNLEDSTSARGATGVAVKCAEAVKVHPTPVDDAICDVGVVLAEDGP